jgi:hypothetical protein
MNRYYVEHYDGLLDAIVYVTKSGWVGKARIEASDEFFIRRFAEGRAVDMIKLAQELNRKEQAHDE